MNERRGEFEQLLERTLRGRVNAASPERMAERIAGAAGREVVVSRRGVGVWPTAVAACLTMVAFSGLQWRRGSERAVVPGMVRPETRSARVVATRTAALDVVPARMRVVGAVRRRARASGWEDAMKGGPKLETFPSTALNPPKPEPGSMEAQLEVLVSLPQSTLVQLAEDQAKEQRASKVQAETEDKLN